jgi:hypothetical protein
MGLIVSDNTVCFYMEMYIYEALTKREKSKPSIIVITLDVTIFTNFVAEKVTSGGKCVTDAQRTALAI